MITKSIIPKSQLEGALRLDAEYYQPKYLELVHSLKKLNFKRLGNLAEVLRGNTPKDYGDYPVAIIRSGDLSGFFINEDLLRTKNENIFYLLKNDILISSIGRGSIGKVNIFTGGDNKFGTVSEVTVIRKIKINPFYLWAFLRSKFGQFQIGREITGSTGQLHLNTGNVENILVPIINNKLIKVFENLYKKAESFYKQSKDFYSQAENLLLEKLELKDFKPEEELTYTTTLSNIKSVHRADAEYFQPKYEKLISKLKSQKTKLSDLVKLNEIFSIRRGDYINPDYYVEDSKRGYIRIKELPLKGKVDLDAIVCIDDNFRNPKLDTLKENDLVFAGIGATLGKTARIPKELEGSFYSNNTARFRIQKKWKDKIDPYYLQIIFQSMICQWQFEQKQAQTAQAKITDKELGEVLILTLPSPEQQKLADFVRQSHEASKRAQELLEEAKQKVEKIVLKLKDSEIYSEI